MSSHGTKVTNDPEATRNPIHEGPGTTVADSLAADSLRQGGSFAAGNPGAGYTGQTAQGTTTNNTDTSGATTLAAAPNAEARGSGEQPGNVLDDTSAPGRGPTYVASATSHGDGKGVYNTLSGGGSNAGAAPTYVVSPKTEEDLKVKGKNLKEGGFSTDAPNASFSGDIGGKKDPGRLAEQQFAARNQESVLDAGNSRDRGVSGFSEEGKFDQLGETSA